MCIGVILYDSLGLYNCRIETVSRRELTNVVLLQTKKLYLRSRAKYLRGLILNSK